MNSTDQSHFFSVVLVLLLPIVAFSGYSYGQKSAQLKLTELNTHLEEKQLEENPIFCTRELKVCGDGSYVKRGGNRCEFAACPPTYDKITLATNLRRPLIEGEEVKPPMNIVLGLPETLANEETISRAEDNVNEGPDAKDDKVWIGTRQSEVAYHVRVNPYSPRGWLGEVSASEKAAKFSDVGLSNGSTMRLWNDKNAPTKISLINPEVDGYQLDEIMVSREDILPFGKDELENWKIIFQQLGTEPTPEHSFSAE